MFYAIATITNKQGKCITRLVWVSENRDYVVFANKRFPLRVIVQSPDNLQSPQNLIYFVDGEKIEVSFTRKSPKLTGVMKAPSLSQSRI